MAHLGSTGRLNGLPSAYIPVHCVMFSELPTLSLADHSDGVVINSPIFDRYRSEKLKNISLYSHTLQSF